MATYIGPKSPLQKIAYIAYFQNNVPSSQQWKFLETRQKGWEKKTRSKNEMDKNKKQEKRDKKQETKGKGLKTINERKWTKGVGRCPLEKDQI